MELCSALLTSIKRCNKLRAALLELYWEYFTYSQAGSFLELNFIRLFWIMSDKQAAPKVSARVVVTLRDIPRLPK